MKSRTNVSIETELIEEVRELKIPLSPLVEDAIRRRLTIEKEKRWKERNKAALGLYNQEIDEEGLFSDDMRTF